MIHAHYYLMLLVYEKEYENISHRSCLFGLLSSNWNVSNHIYLSIYEIYNLQFESNIV